MTSIRHVRTLVYYDGPQVFEAHDAIGGHYIAVMGPSEEIRYLVAGVAPKRLRAFLDGKSDLRTLLEESDAGSRYTTTSFPGEAGDYELTVEPFKEPLKASGFLPPSGFVFDPDDLLSADLIAHTSERDSLAFSMALDTSAHRIASDAYTDVIQQIQALASNVLRAIREAGESWKWKDGLFDIVVPAAPGSLRVTLETSSRQSPEFNARMVDALRRVDELFQPSPNQVVRAATRNRGRIAGTYMKLLQLLVRNETGLRYAWTGRGVQGIHSGAVSIEQALYLKDVLAGTRVRGDTFSREGTLYKYNTQSGHWGLETEGGRLLGWVRDDRPDLAGLRMGWRYRFDCEVEYNLAQEVDDVLKGTVYLLSHELLGPGIRL